MLQETQALELLNAYQAEIELRPYPGRWKLEPKSIATGRAILDADDQMRIAVICAVPSSSARVFILCIPRAGKPALQAQFALYAR
jgi:hypothetical protein